MNEIIMSELDARDWLEYLMEKLLKTQDEKQQTPAAALAVAINVIDNNSWKYTDAQKEPAAPGEYICLTREPAEDEQAPEGCRKVFFYNGLEWESNGEPVIAWCEGPEVPEKE